MRAEDAVVTKQNTMTAAELAGDKRIDIAPDRITELLEQRDQFYEADGGGYRVQD